MSTKTIFIDVNGDRFMPCRCGQIHRGDYAATTRRKIGRITTVSTMKVSRRTTSFPSRRSVWRAARPSSSSLAGLRGRTGEANERLGMARGTGTDFQ